MGSDLYHLARRKDNLLRIAREHPLHPSLYEAQHRPQLVLALLTDAYGLNDRAPHERIAGIKELKKIDPARRLSAAVRLLHKASNTQQRELDALVDIAQRGDKRGRKTLYAGVEQDALFDDDVRHAQLIYAVTTQDAFRYALVPASGEQVSAQELLDREIAQLAKNEQGLLVRPYHGSPWAL